MQKSNQPSVRSVFMNGILGENPVFRLVLGVCPTLAVSTDATSAFGMGLAVTFVLLCSNGFIAAIRNIVPDKVRIPVFVLVICAFVTFVEMMLKAFIPVLFNALGIFLPLIVVNCIILARAEAFAQKNAVVPAVMDGIGMGFGFTLALTLIASIRELIGNGTVFGISLLPATYEPMILLILAPGAFITFGLLLGGVNAVTAKFQKNKSKGGATA